MQRTVGVEEWFNAAGLAEPKRPLWKKLSIDVAWVYPAALIFSVFLAPLLVKIPLGVRVLTSIAAVTIVMQFVVMPIRKRLETPLRPTSRPSCTVIGLRVGNRVSSLVISVVPNGAVAQLAEHFHGMEGVRGSIPLSSTKPL